MKRATVISILCTVMLTACGNVSESVESVETSAVSQTTTTVTGSAVTSGKEEKDTSETTTTTRKSSQTVSETSKPTDITVTTTKKSGSSNANGNSNQGQNNNGQFRDKTIPCRIITVRKITTSLHRIIRSPIIRRQMILRVITERNRIIPPLLR